MSWRARRAYLHSRHRCIYCGEQDAYTLNGRKCCSVCVEKSAARTKKRIEANKEIYAQRRKDQYEDRKDACLCVRCGRPNDGEHVLCDKCRAYANRKMRQYRGPSKTDLGMCRHCGLTNDLASRCYCAACLPKKQEGQKHLIPYAKRPKPGHIWRQWNNLVFKN